MIIEIIIEIMRFEKKVIVVVYNRIKKMSNFYVYCESFVN